MVQSSAALIFLTNKLKMQAILFIDHVLCYINHKFIHRSTHPRHQASSLVIKRTNGHQAY